MRIDWTEYLNQTINVTMSENYGMTMDPKAEQMVNIFIPYTSIKCVEIFDI
jgi:hypothetical protein